jgi:DNA-binding NtrC family response regulator
MDMQVVRYRNHTNAPISMNASIDYASEIVGRDLIGMSKWTQTARMLIGVHASHDGTVILQGERGTGKKLLARLIHRFSSRHEGPFVALSLLSTSEAVARSVLLGAPLGLADGIGIQDKGLAELGEGGTLYIEGFSHLSSSLLGEIIGLSQPRGDSDAGKGVRILLGQAVQTGSDRISATVDVLSAGLDYERIQIPPLRERPEDIEPLTAHFIRERCEQTGKELRHVTPEAMKALRVYDWPCNVTELRTLVNQLVRQLSPPSIDVAVLPAYLVGPHGANRLLPDSGLDLDNEVRRVEVDLICAALRQSRGLQNKAAQLLRIKPTTLFMKIRRHGIDVAAFR